MANYHKPEGRTIQELKDIANKLRIDSVTATNASKSGYVVIFLYYLITCWQHQCGTAKPDQWMHPRSTCWSLHCENWCWHDSEWGRAMSRVVSRRSKAEDQVEFFASQFRVCVGTATGSAPSTFVLPSSLIPPFRNIYVAHASVNKKWNNRDKEDCSCVVGFVSSCLVSASQRTLRLPSSRFIVYGGR